MDLKIERFYFFSDQKYVEYKWLWSLFRRWRCKFDILNQKKAKSIEESFRKRMKVLFSFSPSISALFLLLRADAYQIFFFFYRELSTITKKPWYKYPIDWLKQINSYFSRKFTIMSFDHCTSILSRDSNRSLNIHLDSSCFDIRSMYVVYETRSREDFKD